MTEVDQLLAEIKRELRTQKLTYRDVAQQLGISEPSVKRVFASGACTLERLAQIAAMLNLSVVELAQAADATNLRPTQLTLAPGARAGCRHQAASRRGRDQSLEHGRYHTRVPAINHAECVERLLQLERLKLIVLLPGNRIRLNLARDFDCLTDGPIR
ncbi:helix-turn-helix transcriptional regulator [Paraburkholderia bonniea]|uniref:helix-turn-helix domain-containing protein n=1 Tax=Paraburkholderia bonniea TaxID=2152891 RepID=UPI0031B5919B